MNKTSLAQWKAHAFSMCNLKYSVYTLVNDDLGISFNIYEVNNDTNSNGFAHNLKPFSNADFFNIKWKLRFSFFDPLGRLLTL